MTPSPTTAAHRLPLRAKGLYSLAQLLLEHGAEVDRAVADGASAIVLAAALVGSAASARFSTRAPTPPAVRGTTRPRVGATALPSPVCRALEGPVVGKAAAASATFLPAAPRAAGAGARVSEVLADAGTRPCRPRSTCSGDGT